jgi:plasmid stabilization system protein ParE
LQPKASPYRILYLLEKSRIFILSVRHGKQILPVDEIMAEARKGQ